MCKHTQTEIYIHKSKLNTPIHRQFYEQTSQDKSLNLIFLCYSARLVSHSSFSHKIKLFQQSNIMITKVDSLLRLLYLPNITTLYYTRVRIRRPPIQKPPLYT